ncbi:hypothetical protein N7519_008330 [Penicillium mononematosum]|uniref:uncharacterized protein n=1 Tax=Penicillium mononematosum TaxID=268346 RepID=UPI002546BDD4|nr:uncharacterized protein N7519_008330 [Penicillium mononematosum]KAJ6177869.1 hypothetical protein N7519_008330 [Penicillium mononematosum]
MADDSMPREEIIGVVIGAVALFSLISMIPVLIMWHHRRRTAMRAMAETRVLPPVYQVQLQNVLGQPVSVDRWLEEQSLTRPAPFASRHCRHPHTSPVPTQPFWPTASTTTTRIRRHVQPPHCSCGAQHSPPDSEVLILNRCKHAFHLDCLKSWFEYRRYKCPICQASYSPEEERRG